MAELKHWLYRSKPLKGKVLELLVILL